MKFNTHFFAGLLLAILFLRIFSLSFTQELALLVCTLLAAIMPDFDFATHYIAPKNVPFVHWLLTHRGASHSIYPLILLSLFVLILFSWQVATGFFAAYFSHLFLDALTKKGIDLTGRGKRIKGPVTYDGTTNLFIATTLLVLSVLLLAQPLISLFFS